LLTVLHHQARRDGSGSGDRQAHRRGAGRRGRRSKRRRGWSLGVAAPAARDGGRVSRATILVVDDDQRLRHALSLLLRTAGYEVVTAANVQAAEDALRESEVDLVISDVRMPGGSGLDLLEIVRRLEIDALVILLTAYGTIENAVEAMRKGAFDYLLKPFDAEEMKVRVSRALALRRYRTGNEFRKEEQGHESSFDDLIGVSAKIRQVIDLVKQIAPSEASVLISGETGTGKEVVARAIHRRSGRHERLLVPVNLAAVPTE